MNLSSWPAFSRAKLFAALFLIGIAAASISSARAEIWLDGAWGEGMMLQSGVKAPLHGRGKPGEAVAIQFRGKSYETVVDKFSAWKVEIEPGDAGGPFGMTIKGEKTIELKDVHVVELKLASVFGEGMVLQRGEAAPVFGTAFPGSKVAVEFRGTKYETTADAGSAWRVDVVPGDAGGPFAMTVAGKQTISLKEVYVGEVWVCAGQSNMRWGVSYTQDAGKLALDPPNPLLRLQMPNDVGYSPNHPARRFEGWKAADKKSVMAFSGTGYYFGAAIQEKLRVPVGLIQAATDATSIQQWLPGDKLKALKLGSGADGDQYASRVRTIQPYGIRGIIWYQGEGDASKDVYKLGYHPRQTALIDGWRRDWGQGEFPFLFVQLPRIGFGAEQVHNGKLPTGEQKEIVGEWARVRDEQRQVLSLAPKTAMAIYYEQTTGTLHPAQKRVAGERLALAARALAYAEAIEFSGPLVKAARRDGDEVVVSFTHATGLATKDAPLRQFEVAGADGIFTTAKAMIVGETVRLSVAGVKGPLTIRYAHREWPDGNLFNAAGLPASPFVWPGIE